MAIIGGQINPAYYPQPDYSGVVRSAQMQSQGIANIGQQIGGAIKQYGDDEKTIKKSAQMAKSIRDAIPELADMANNSLEQLSNPDLSQRDRLAIAEGIQDSLKIGVMGLENKRSNAMMQLEAAKIAAAANKEPQGTFMTTQEFSGLMNSGVPVKGVPMPDGRVFVTDISGNQPGILGSGVAMVNGQPTKIPTTPVNLPSWGAGASIQNALPEGQGGIFPDNVAPTGLPIDQTAEFMPGVSVDGSPGVLPPRPGAVQQIPYVQRVINDVNNGFAYGNTGANVTPPARQDALMVATNQINGFNPNNITAEQAKLLQAVGEDKLIPSFDSKGNVTAYAIPGTPAEQQQKLNSLAIKKAELDAEGEKRKNEGEDEKKLRLEDYKNSQANAILYNINNALTDISKVPQGEGFAGGAWRAALGKYVPNSSVAQLDQSLATISNVIASDSLYKMRMASPTGGALGNTSNADIELLKNSIVALNSVKDPKKLQEGLYVVQMRFLDTIHGTESERKAKLKSGNIDQESFDYVESLYPPIKINDRGQAVPRKTKEIDIFNKIEINPEIQKMLNQ
jgi:hypothetical protein